MFLKQIYNWLRGVRPSFSRKQPKGMNLYPIEPEPAIFLVVPYDENLLERSRTQWQFGDWQSLSQLDREMIQHHPDRAELAILSAAAHQQTGDMAAARQFTRLAREWGCNKKLISQILISGVHNTLGKASAIAGKWQQAFDHFESSITTANPGGDLRLLIQARTQSQLESIKIAGTILPNAAQPEKRVYHSEGNTLNIAFDSVYAQKLNNIGESLFEAEKYKEAVELFQIAFDLQPNSAWYCQNLAESLARFDYRQEESWESKKIEELFKKQNKWDVTVRHYWQALKIDPHGVEEHKNSQIFAAEPHKKDDRVEHPVFIVGCGHSGTSLMLALLGNHPSFYPIPKESALFLRTDSFINNQMHQWDLKCKEDGKSRWVEKTPPHIFQVHRFIALRPNSQFILMLRDGRDVVCSLKPRIGYTNFETRLDRWIYDNMAGLPYWEHPKVKVVKYEDLIINSKKTLRSICQFLGEEYNEKMLDYHKTEHHWYSDKIIKPEAIRTHRDHMNNRNWQINQPIFDGRGRWIKEMSIDEKEIFKRSPAQNYLEKFGYVNNSNW